MQKSTIKNKICSVIILAPVLVSSFFVSFAFAAVTFDETGGNPIVSNPEFQLVPDCAHGSGVCGYNDLITLANTIINFLIVISASIAVLSFCYAGFLYITAFGQAGKIEQAHGIFTKAIVGMLFVLLGWLIVATILKTLNVDQSVVNTVNFNDVQTIQQNQK